jgi:hypothetical protein
MQTGVRDDNIGAFLFVIALPIHKASILSLIAIHR